MLLLISKRVMLMVRSALFGGFLDFLAAIFPFLPPEITTILTFGVIAITFIGILKAVRR